MNNYKCSVCGYVQEGSAPDRCPQCNSPKEKFYLLDESEEMTWADMHVVGISKGVNEELLDDLRANFVGECSEVGMYLAMSRQADREGYPEIAEAYKRIAFEEAEHASKFAEMLGEVLVPNTKKNLEMRIQAEHGACAGKKEIANKTKELGLDAIHDTVHEMCKDESRHGLVFKGLLERYF